MQERLEREQEPAELIETLTGWSADDLAAAGTLSELRVVQHLVAEALDIKEHEPLLRVIGG